MRELRAGEFRGARRGLPRATRACTAARARRASSTRCRTTSRTSACIALILPNAKIIDARRHPLDACLSCYRQLFAKGQNFTYDLTEIGEYYLQYQRMMDHWAQRAAGPGADGAVRGGRRGFRAAGAAAARVLRAAMGRRLPALLRERAARCARRARSRCASRSTTARSATGGTTSAHLDELIAVIDADPRPLPPLRARGRRLRPRGATAARNRAGRHVVEDEVDAVRRRPCS